MENVFNTKLYLFDQTLRDLTSQAFRAILNNGIRDCDSFLTTDINCLLENDYHPTIIHELIQAQNELESHVQLIEDVEQPVNNREIFLKPLSSATKKYNRVSSKRSLRVSTFTKINEMPDLEIWSKDSILKFTLPQLFFKQEDVDQLWEVSSNRILGEIFDFSHEEWEKLNARYIYQEDLIESFFALTVGCLVEIKIGADLFDKMVEALKIYAESELDLQNFEINNEIMSDISIIKESEIGTLKEYRMDSWRFSGPVFVEMQKYGFIYWGDLTNISEKKILDSNNFSFYSLEQILHFWKLKHFVEVAKNLMNTWEEDHFQSFSTLVDDFLRLSTQKARDITILRGRIGAIDGIKHTLEEIGEEQQITRERVRQIEKKCLIKLKLEKNMIKLNRLWYAIETILKDRRGVCTLDNLSKEISKMMGWGTEPKITPLMELTKLSSKFQFMKFEKENNFIFDYTHKCLQCRIPGDEVLKAINESNTEKDFEQVREIIYQACISRKECRAIAKHTRCLDDYISCLVCKSDTLNLDGNVIYSEGLWTARYGSKTQIVEKFLKKSGEQIHFTDLYLKLKELFPHDEDLSERNVHAYLSRCENILLWDRGTFIHQDHVNIDLRLLHEIKCWIVGQLEEGVPFVSVAGVFSHFEKACARNDIPSESALYTCLRLFVVSDLSYPKYPQIYLSDGFESIIPVHIALEQYIRDADGYVKDSELKKYAKKSLMLKDFQYEQSVYNYSDDILTGKKGFISFSKLSIDEKKLEEIYTYIKETVGKYRHVSIKKIYQDKRVSCISANIEDSKILYSVLKRNFKDLELSNYPIVTILDRDIQDPQLTITGEIKQYIEDKKAPCSLDELEKVFIQKHGYSGNTLNAILSKEEILRYGKGSFVHLRSLGWTKEKNNKLIEEAMLVYEQGKSVNGYHGLLNELWESTVLFGLENNILWTKTLLGELLLMTGKFRVLGNAKNVFVPKNNTDGIEVFEDLVYVILRDIFEGAEELSKFAEYLQKIGIVQKRVTKSMLGEQKKVCISRNLIMLREYANA